MTSQMETPAWDQLCAACQTSVAALSKTLDRLSRAETSHGHIYTPHLFYPNLLSSHATCHLCADIVSRGVEEREQLTREYLFWNIVFIVSGYENYDPKMDLLPRKISLTASHSLSLSNSNVKFASMVKNN
jgi:hypothetical protein